LSKKSRPGVIPGRLFLFSYAENPGFDRLGQINLFIPGSFIFLIHSRTENRAGLSGERRYMAYYGKLEDIINEIGESPVKDKALRARLLDGLHYLRGLDKKFFLDCKEDFRETEEINGRDVYAVHQVYRTKPAELARFETHRIYIDLQYLWSGAEDIYLASERELQPLGRYSRNKDIRFWGGPENVRMAHFLGCASRLRMQAGSLAILYPSDAHAPSISCGRRSLVAKSVVKVRV